MGKVRPRTIGDEEAEKQEKAEQKQKAAEKKAKKAEKEPKEVKMEEKTSEIEEKPAKKEKKESKKAVEATSKHGKKYKEVRKAIEKGKVYSITEAVSVLKKVKYAKFDESVELHLNVEKTGLKGEVDMPHSTGKTTKVAVVSDELLGKLDEGVVDFDVLVTHPSYMPKLARYAKLLGPRGLMPNPKAGTISEKPEELVKKFAGGTLRWKSEPKFPLVHQMVGKISMSEDQISENVTHFVKSVGRVNISKAVLSTTMGPGLQVSIENL